MFNWFVKKINNRKGFTLIELVVVIAILGILSAIAVPKFGASRVNAANTAHNANVRTLESAANMFIATKGATVAAGTYTTSAPGDNKMGDYVQTWPTLPNGGTYAATPTVYTVEITSTGGVTVTPAAVTLP